MLQACWLQPGSSQSDGGQALQTAGMTESIHPWSWRAPTAPGKRANTALLAQLGAKRAKAQLSKDLAHQDRDTTFACPAARGAPEQEAPSPACLLHHGEHLPALELMVVLLRRCHDEATLGSRSETHPFSNESPGSVQSIIFICREQSESSTSRN